MDTSVDLAQGSTLAKQIRDILMDRILSGELKPGTRLKDNEVAASFHASNTPVREALRLLAQDGLVEIIPYRGCVVRSVNARDLADLLDVRAALEAFAARTAAQRQDGEQLQALQAAVEAYDAACAAGDWEGAGAADRRFHHLLAETTGNRVLIQGLRRIANRLHVLGRVHQGRTPHGRATCQAILEAMQAGDGEQAAALVSEHIADGKARVLAVLEAGAKRES